MIAAFWPKDAENPLVVLDLEAEHQVIELLDKAYIKKREGEWHEAVGHLEVNGIHFPRSVYASMTKELVKHFPDPGKVRKYRSGETAFVACDGDGGSCPGFLVVNPGDERTDCPACGRVFAVEKKE